MQFLIDVKRRKNLYRIDVRAAGHEGTGQDLKAALTDLIGRMEQTREKLSKVSQEHLSEAGKEMLKSVEQILSPEAGA